MSNATEPAALPGSAPLILGLGNPILRDDGVGLAVARALFDSLPAGTAFLKEAGVGGIELLHVLEGWERVLIVDSLEPGKIRPGEVVEIRHEDLEQKYTPLSPHNAGLMHCLKLGRACGMAMPEEVKVFAIGVSDPYSFSERCTDEVEAAIPGIVRFIEDRVFGAQGCWKAWCRRDDQRHTK